LGETTIHYRYRHWEEGGKQGQLSLLSWNLKPTVVAAFNAARHIAASQCLQMLQTRRYMTYYFLAVKTR